MWSSLSRRSLVGKITVINWYIIAVFNPLQAFFNALVYRKWGDKFCSFCACKDWLLTKMRLKRSAEEVNETAPLLRSTTLFSQSQSNENLLENDREDVERFHRFSIQCPLV
jgi:ocular albinism type 1 protein